MDEKATVKQALQTPLVHNDVWQPIATAWFDKWKAYINYNDDEQTVGARHPGPVRNRTLKGSFTEELRRDLVAERDYVLLPHAAAQMLLTKYGGGPKFRRRVRTSPVDLSLAVDLWLVRTNLYLCDSSQPTPVSRRGPKYHRCYSMATGSWNMSSTMRNNLFFTLMLPAHPSDFGSEKRDLNQMSLPLLSAVV
eukprot:gene17345-12399_t